MKELFRQPTLDYIRSLRVTLEKDPGYLDFHSGSVSLKVRELVARSGTSIDRAMPDSEVIKMVRNAVLNLRSFEKG